MSLEDSWSNKEIKRDDVSDASYLKVTPFDPNRMSIGKRAECITQIRQIGNDFRFPF